jgi:RHS repeat-associated protein
MLLVYCCFYSNIKNPIRPLYVNGDWKTGSGSMPARPKCNEGGGNYTVYVNPYIVLKSGGYTKHYYIEGQRIVSKLGGGLDNKGKGPLKAGEGKVNYSTKHDELFEGIVRNLKWLAEDGSILTAGKSGKIPPGQIIGNSPGNGGTESFQYFYHPDHLGSTSYITDASGEVYQHLEYFAFGETFVEEHNNTDKTPYLFNGKELDEETGLYYYGARYYDAQTSIWLSVDPLAEAYPNVTPYNYVLNNPIKSIDPNGMSTYTDADGNVVGGTVDDKDKGVYMVDGLTKDSFDAGKINDYKEQGTRIGSTLSMNSFIAPEDGKWRGKVNFTNEAESNLSEATAAFGSYMSDHRTDESLSHYMSEAGNGGDYDIKAWGVNWNELSGEQKLDHVYQASFASAGIIMTKRDQGNFFAGRAANMMGLPLSTTLSGFGAFQSNANKRGFMFYIKSALNQIDQIIMGAAIQGTPMDGMSVRPVFPDHRGSEDLQRAGYNQYTR